MTISSMTLRLVTILGVSLIFLGAKAPSACAIENNKHIKPLNKVQPALAMNAKDAPKLDVAGLVLKVSGDWQSNFGEKVHSIRRGDSVPNGWSLKPTSEDAAITVALLDGTILKCPGCAACSGPLVVSKAPSAAESWLSTAISMFVQKPNAWIAPVSRGLFMSGQNAGLADSVLMANAGKLDLSPIFPQKPDGTYYVSIYRTPEQGSSARCFGPLALNLKHDQPIEINAPEIKGGLYKVNISEDENDPQGEEAWILVSDKKHYQDKAQAFHNAISMSESMKADVTPNTVRELLRAYMASLNSSGISQSK